jgi:hypothetical protein
MIIRCFVWATLTLAWIFAPPQITLRVRPQACLVGQKVTAKVSVEDDAIDRVKLRFYVDGAFKGSEEFTVAHTDTERVYTLDEAGTWDIVAEGFNAYRVVASSSVSVTVQ